MFFRSLIKVTLKTGDTTPLNTLFFLGNLIQGRGMGEGEGGGGVRDVKATEIFLGFSPIHRRKKQQQQQKAFHLIE